MDELVSNNVYTGSYPTKVSHNGTDSLFSYDPMGGEDLRMGVRRGRQRYGEAQLDSEKNTKKTVDIF